MSSTLKSARIFCALVLRIHFARLRSTANPPPSSVSAATKEAGSISGAGAGELCLSVGPTVRFVIIRVMIVLVHPRFSMICTLDRIAIG